MRMSGRIWAVVVAATVGCAGIVVAVRDGSEPAVQVAADRGRPTAPFPDADAGAREPEPGSSTTATTTPASTTTVSRPETVSSAPTTATTAPAPPTAGSPSEFSGPLRPPVIAKEPYPHARGSGISGQLPAGGSIYPFDPRRTLWEASHDGYSLRVQVDPASVKAGEPVRLFTEFSGPPGGQCCMVLVGWGQPRYQNPDGTCPPEKSYEGWSVFNEPGPVVFEAIVYECAYPSPKPKVWLLGTLDVAVGKGTRQGPALPEPTVLDGGGVTGADPRLVRIGNINIEDVDGFVVGFQIDWGDGSPVETYPGQNPAPDPLNPVTPGGCVPRAPHGWPTSGFHTKHVDAGEYGWIRWDGPQQFDHLYPDDGPYTVTITARSTACDLVSVPQQGSTTFEWTPGWNL